MSNTQFFRSKIKAFAYHFLLSAIIMLMTAGIIFYLWYPKPFYQMFGVSTIFMLMLGIDLILGPLLTFIVYKKGKKTLKTDLAIIGLLQLVAFGWGMWNIAIARPAWIAIYKDAAYAVSPALLKNPENNPQGKLPSLFSQSWTKPRLVMVDTKDSIPLAIYQPENYMDYNPSMAVKYKLPLSKIDTFDHKFYQKILAEYPTATGYLPIITEASTDIALILINAEGKVLNIVMAEKM